MKKLWLIITVIFPFVFVSVLTAQNVSPQFSELKGMEDAQGNTHLLYRIYSHQHSNDFDSGRNDIFNLVPGTSIDTIYLHDGYTCGPYMGWGTTIFDFDYWENDLSKYIISGDFVTCFEPSPFISRFDSGNVYTDWSNFTNDIYISKQNDSLLFGLPNLISYDGGFTWDTLQLEYAPISIADFDDNVYFAIDYAYLASSIYKSTNSGNSFYLVDTAGTNWNTKFYYDVDNNHVYRTFFSDLLEFTLKGSSNQGDVYKRQSKY